VLLLKLTLTPILIAVATLATRRWGPTIGGWFAGLPLTSGPVSFFLVLEQGGPFAATAARTSILGLIGVAAFGVAYSRAPMRFGPAGCLAVGFTAYALVTLASQKLDVGPWSTVAAVCVALAAALTALPRTHPVRTEETAPWWDLPLRIIAATGTVLVITTAATRLGPTWSGLLSPFPVFSSILAAFAHATSGRAAATRLQRGIIVGVFSFAAFFLVVALLVERRSLAETYVAASAAALAINGASLVGLRRLHR
jgi:hypothetical protein